MIEIDLLNGAAQTRKANERFKKKSNRTSLRDLALGATYYGLKTISFFAPQLTYGFAVTTMGTAGAAGGWIAGRAAELLPGVLDMAYQITPEYIEHPVAGAGAITAGLLGAAYSSVNLLRVRLPRNQHE